MDRVGLYSRDMGLPGDYIARIQSLEWDYIACLASNHRSTCHMVESRTQSCCLGDPMTGTIVGGRNGEVMNETMLRLVMVSWVFLGDSDHAANQGSHLQLILPVKLTKWPPGKRAGAHDLSRGLQSTRGGT